MPNLVDSPVILMLVMPRTITCSHANSEPNTCVDCVKDVATSESGAGRNGACSRAENIGCRYLYVVPIGTAQPVDISLHPSLT